MVSLQYALIKTLTFSIPQKVPLGDDFGDELVFLASPKL